jgi:hypothetical protein
MKLPGTSWFWSTAAIIAVVAVCLAPGQVRAAWNYKYDDDFDDFRTNFAEDDSDRHSVFWPQGAFPPQEPYLYFLDTDSGRELGFGGYQAILGYSFVTGLPESRRVVSGSLQVDVRFSDDIGVTPSLSGYLLYRLSPDGVYWSDPKELQSGRHDIPIESVEGTCHIRFFGTDVLIDNLEVHLSAQPATRHVPGDFSTIQDAIHSSEDGDVVEVAPGTYTGDGNWNIDFGGKAITVRSRSGPGRTTINCAGQRGFYFHNSEGSDSVLRGFTITGGSVQGSDLPSEGASWISSSTHPVGGGIFCESSSPSIINCVIKDCSAQLGGGIAVVGGSPKIVDCVIEYCDADAYGAGIGLIRGADATMIDCTIQNNVAHANSRGAGVYCRQSTARLVNCDISNNGAQGSVSGGGLYCGGSPAGVVLENCLISNNIAGAGGGIFAESFDYVRLTNCTVADNTAAASSGGGIHAVGGDIVIRNSIVWDNGNTGVLLSNLASGNPVLYSNIQGSYPGPGNINLDPLFASPTAGDYHLKSGMGRYDSPWDPWATDIVNGTYIYSPCIDAGDPQSSVGSEPFPNNSQINMGAYGGTAEASKSYGPLIWHVDRDGGNDFNSGLSRNNAFATIQRAVLEALDGDTVMVWPGVYTEQVSFKGKAITVQSADEAAVVTAPSIPGYAFSFYGAEDSRSVLRNFIIIDCGTGAIECQNGAWPTLTNLTMVGNQFGVVGTGGADPSITNCIFWNNDAGDLEGCRAYYSNLQELKPLDAVNGNISMDPFFADPAGGDYHLQSRYGRYSYGTGAWVTDPLTSPCIDAGDPDLGVGREPTPNKGIVNMGAYGGTPFASKSGW